jgi:Na+/H+ antiporter NhaC
VLGLLGNYELGQSSVSILAGSVPLNFYALITVGIVLFTVISGRVFGPLRVSEQAVVVRAVETDEVPASRARYMLLPLAVLLISMLALMFVTGDGNFMAGDGSRAVLYSALLATGTAYLLLRIDSVFTHGQAMEHAFNGMKSMLPLIAILVVSIAFGASLKALGTGTFVASLIGSWLPLVLVVPMLFVAGALISFATGTSWGTFAILIPIGVPLIQAFGLPPSLVLAAILGGGVFGDHCSPISDSTFVTAMASGCAVLEHVRTQLPYALTAAALAFAAYLLAGAVML